MMAKESPNATAEINLDYVRKKSNHDTEESFNGKSYETLAFVSCYFFSLKKSAKNHFS